MNQFLKLVKIHGHDPMTSIDRVCYYVNITNLRGTRVIPAWGSTNRLCGRLYEKAKGDLKAARAATRNRFLAVTVRVAHRTIARSDSRFSLILAQSEQDWTRNLHHSAIQCLKNRVRQDTGPIQTLNIQSVKWAKQGFSGVFYALRSAGSVSSWLKGIVQNWQPVQNGLQWYWSNQIVVDSSNRGGNLARLKALRKEIKKFT